MIVAQSFTQGIAFIHDSTIAQLKKRARVENKLIFIDAFTTWCGPCKWMTANVFPNDTVGKYFNEHFIAAKIDMEKGEGLSIAQKFKVNAYPTYLFLDSTGKEVHRALGAVPSKEFILVGQTATDPNRRMAALQKKYENGARDAQFIREYILSNSTAGKDVQELVYWYIALLKPEELITKENFNLIALALNSTKSPIYEVIYKYRDGFKNAVGVDEYENIMLMAHRNDFALSFSRKRDQNGKTVTTVIPKEYDMAVSRLRQSGISKAEEIIAEYDLKCVTIQNDWKKSAPAIKNYIEKYAMNKFAVLNEYAWKFYETSTDKTELLWAASWAKKSVELNEMFMNTDTYAALLYKVKNKKEAFKVQKRSIELGEKEGEDLTEGKARLELIKNLK